jgi:chemotaxis protein methyltransferase CheR
MVTLRPGNLIKDYFPSYTSGIHDMDIIICRNVFIYFDSNSIAVVLEKFCNTLRLGGYLVAGHTELQGQSLGQLQTKVFAESVVYQRGEGLRVETPLAISQALPVSDSLSSSRMLHENIAIKESSTTNSSNLVKTTSETVLSQAEIFFYKSDYTKVIEEAEQVIKQHPQHFAAYSLIAQALANLGESEKAISYCQQALKIDSLSVTPYYLLAHIAEEQGDIEKAKEIFKKIIYLAPSSIPAYLELGSIYEKEGDATKARKVRSTALELLKELPADSFVQPNSEITVGELFLQVKNLLRNNT